MYSQHDEEKYIVEAVKGVDVCRRALDIGAWDPKTFSNSRALIEAGWDAVLIEPSPGPLRNLVMEYGEWGHHAGLVSVIGAAVTVEPRKLIELAITDDATSSKDAEHVEKWQQHSKFIGRLSVGALTVADILELFGAFNFVNIDAEGSSVDIFKAVLATEMFPVCICVEHDGRHVEAMQAAADRGYQQVYATEENLVFAR